jgi:hypothetical protein
VQIRYRPAAAACFGFAVAFGPLLLGADRRKAGPKSVA